MDALCRLTREGEACLSQVQRDPGAYYALLEKADLSGGVPSMERQNLAIRDRLRNLLGAEIKMSALQIELEVASKVDCDCEAFKEEIARVLERTDLSRGVLEEGCFQWANIDRKKTL